MRPKVFWEYFYGTKSAIIPKIKIRIGPTFADWPGFQVRPIANEQLIMKQSYGATNFLMAGKDEILRACLIWDLEDFEIWR